MVTFRRHLLLYLSILVFLSPPVGFSNALPPSEPARSFSWRVPIAHLHVVKDNLEFQGTITPEEDTKGGPLVFVFAGLALLPNLADSVLALRREVVHGGVVVDTRGAEIKITSDPRLDGGVMVVVSNEGTQIYERDELWDPTELLKAMAPALMTPPQAGHGCSMMRRPA